MFQSAICSQQPSPAHLADPASLQTENCKVKIENWKLRIAALGPLFL
jgi:hypothetical protein